MKHINGFWLPSTDTYFGPILAQGHGFELDHLERALQFVTDFTIAVDAGAHVGIWTTTMAEYFATIHAFEPSDDAFECLEKNTVGLGGVHLHHLALGHKPGRCSMRESGSRAGNTGARYVSTGSDTVIAPLDAWNLQAVGFLKIDTEGYEMPVLEGARDTIARCHPVILVEQKRFKDDLQHRPPIPHDAAGILLVSWGYRLVERAKNDCVFVWG
jgi:FkbM family methyltransferase